MYLFYSIVLTAGFLLMSPLFLVRREKYAAGFSQRLGNYPAFKQDGRPVIWLHCVSVGEVNAARPLVQALTNEFPTHRLIVSTTTKTGQELAQKIFAERSDAIFYFPFDWKFSVRRTLQHFNPSTILLMETEIWPRLIREAKEGGVNVAIISGRLSDRSFRRYSKIRGFISRVLADIDLALMQGGNDANRLISLGLTAAKAQVTGNLKFDMTEDPRDEQIAAELDSRFKLRDERPVIVAASTHDPEEHWIFDAFCSVLAGAGRKKPRLVIAPRHPERFDAVARFLMDFRDHPACEYTRYRFARRSKEPLEDDRNADVILLDSIGELRALYRLTDIAFVGGSLIAHGGQSILEPASAGNAIITGLHMDNFTDAVRTFLDSNALIQLPEMRPEIITDELFLQFSDLLEEPEKLAELGSNARSVMSRSRGATKQTMASLEKLL